MESIVIPGYSNYQVLVDDVGIITTRWKSSRMLNSRDNNRLRFTLVSDKGVKKRAYINYWRRLCGLPPIDRRFRCDTKSDFFKNTKKDGECIIWTGSKSKSGYGIIQTGANKMKYADSLSYYFKHGGVYRRDLVHTCGNRSCVNPDHLRIGTKEEQFYYERIRHLNDDRILFALSDKYVLDTSSRKVFANRYKDLKELKPNSAGRYVLFFDNTQHYMSFDEMLEGKLIKRKKDKRDIDYFWEKVRKTDDLSDCWEWIGAKASGYGNFGTSLMGETRAHRISYTLMNGSIEKDYLVMHKCDNPSCVNPFHLTTGTNKDNNQDKINKGRHLLNSKNHLDTNKMRKLIENDIEYRDIEKIFDDFTPSTVYARYSEIRQENSSVDDRWV